MGNGEREDENRKLAEWLGYVPHAPSEVTNKPYLLWRSPMPPYDYLDHLPDFRTDEHWNAMLLEKMATVTIDWKLLPNRTFGGAPIWSFVFHDDEYIDDPDRKTAIVLAALALLNERGRW